MSNDDMHDPFERLKGAAAPGPRAEAKKRAMAAGMAAFEAAQKKSSPTTQGSSWGQRLTSIITSWKGKSIMDMRLPIGTAAIALLILPLGYQLYSTTSMTPADAVPPRPVIVEQPVGEVAQTEERAKQPVDTAATGIPEPSRASTAVETNR